MIIPNTFEIVSPEDIAANTHKGVCNIVTNKDILVLDDLCDPNMDINITCKNFMNAAQLKCSSMAISATEGDLINAGTIETKKGDIDLKTNKILVSSTYMNSSGNLNLNANKIFGLGIVKSTKDIKFHGDYLFNFGIKMTSDANIYLYGKEYQYNGVIMHFKNSGWEGLFN